jgi:hypothetical protein
MRSVCSLPVYRAVTTTLALSALLAWAAPVSAQSFGLGPRLAWVTADVDADVDAARFVGGQIRILPVRFGVEVSLDRHSETFDLLNQKVTETPIQASLLWRLGGGRVSPILLGGPGWYRRKVEALGGDADQSVSTTEFGWHAGIGLEIRAGGHFGIHGDYRYTFLDFDDDNDDDEDNDDEGFIGGLLPGHRGSMWTLGVSYYF